MDTIDFDKASDILLEEDIIVIDESGEGFAYPYRMENGNIKMEFNPYVSIEINRNTKIALDDLGMMVVDDIPLRVAKVIRLEV